MNNAMNKVVILKDGSVLRASVNQLEKLNMAILSRHDFQDIKVKLDGRTFKLGEIETDMEKIAAAQQSKLDLNDERPKRKQDWA